MGAQGADNPSMPYPTGPTGLLTMRANGILLIILDTEGEKCLKMVQYSIPWEFNYFTLILLKRRRAHDTSLCLI
jgi:hypothetical protein